MMKAKHCEMSPLSEIFIITKSDNSRLGILTTLRAGRPRDRGSISGTDKRFICSRKGLDRLWSPHSLLFNGDRGFFATG
jgi:hypothetical protein